MIEAMLDIETLDTDPQAVVLQIALVVFDTADNYEVKKIHSWHLSAKSQCAAGRTISVETLGWWLQQSDGAIEEVLSRSLNGTTVHHDVALSELQQVIAELNQQHGLGKIWARGDMDFYVIENMFGRRQLPWKYYQKGDCRSVYDFARGLGVDVDEIQMNASGAMTAHNAVDDCVIQISILRDINKWLSQKKT